jgi:hypothetical protein
MPAPPPKGAVSQLEMSGDFGISGERPAAPSSTISAAAATSASASSVASAGAQRSLRTCARPRSLCAATLTKR